MLSRHTSEAIVALLTVDPQASEDDKHRIVAAITGEGDGGVLTKKDAAARVGVSRPTFDRMLKAGMIESLEDGRVSEAAISRYLSNLRKVG